MNFRKSSKRPLTPLPSLIFGKSIGKDPEFENDYSAVFLFHLFQNTFNQVQIALNISGRYHFFGPSAIFFFFIGGRPGALNTLQKKKMITHYLYFHHHQTCGRWCRRGWTCKILKGRLSRRSQRPLAGDDRSTPPWKLDVNLSHTIPVNSIPV